MAMTGPLGQCAPGRGTREWNELAEVEGPDQGLESV